LGEKGKYFIDQGFVSEENLKIMIAASVVSPNPVTVGSAIHVVAEIYENC